MDLRQLRSFVTLAKLKNITKTAEMMNLSAAAVHKQLKNLEEELEAPLYEKIGRRLQLTPAAQVLLPHATDLLMRYESTLEALREWKGAKRAVVRLGSGPGISIALLPELLAEFRALYADIEVVVETGSTVWLIDKLLEGGLDIAIMVSPGTDGPGPARLTEEVSWDFRIVLVTAVADAPRRCSLQDLASVPFILFKSGSQVEKAIDAYMAEHRFHPRVSMRFDNVEAIKAMLKIGPGISLLPQWAVVHEVHDGGLKLIQQTEPPLISRIVIAVRTGGYLSDSARALIETARQHRNSWLNEPPGRRSRAAAATASYGARIPRQDRRRSRTPDAPRPQSP